MEFIRILKKKLPIIIAFLVILLCVGLIIETLLIYFRGADGAIYSREIVKKALGHFLLPLVLLVVLVLLAARWHIPQEKHTLKTLPKRNFILQQATYKKKCLTVKVYMLIYLLGLILVIAGVCNGGLNDVLIKAVNICTECIGLG